MPAKIDISGQPLEISNGNMYRRHTMKALDIQLTPCSSSQIHAHGFDPATNTLALQFKSKGGPGSIYHYANVTQADYDAFCQAESKCSHFGKVFKPAAEKYPFQRIAEPPKS